MSEYVIQASCGGFYREDKNHWVDDESPHLTRYPDVASATAAFERIVGKTTNDYYTIRPAPDADGSDTVIDGIAVSLAATRLRDAHSLARAITKEDASITETRHYVIKSDDGYLTPKRRWTQRPSLARHWAVYDDADAHARGMVAELEGRITPLPKLDVVPVRKKARPPTEADRALAEIRKDRMVAATVRDTDLPALFRQHEERWMTEYRKVGTCINAIAFEVGQPPDAHDRILGAIKRREGAGGRLLAIDSAVRAAGATTTAIIGADGTREVTTLERVEWLIDRLRIAQLTKT